MKFFIIFLNQKSLTNCGCEKEENKNSLNDNSIIAFFTPKLENLTLLLCLLQMYISIAVFEKYNLALKKGKYLLSKHHQKFEEL